MLSTKEKKNNKDQKSNKKLFYSKKIGIVLASLGVVLLLLIFYPVILAELRYLFSSGDIPSVEIEKNIENDVNNKGENIIIPKYKDFGIVIPKIFVNVKIIPNVNPQSSREYQQALSKGVAQAKHTALPDEEGNMFIFAHSGEDFYQANRFNAVFYLLGKMKEDDEIYVFYKNGEYVYKVKEKKIVSPDNIEYLNKGADNKTLTLMTCWPAGTTLKRMIVIAEQM